MTDLTTDSELRFQTLSEATGPVESRKQTRPPRMPRLKDIVISVPLGGHKLILRKGTSSRSSCVIQDSPEEVAKECLALMDGTRSWSQIIKVIVTRWSHVDVRALSELYEGLYTTGVLEDAGPPPSDFSADELSRFSRNFNCWSSLSIDGSTRYEMQRRMRKGSALVLGAGGLGSCCALGLSMAGVGRLILVDHDLLELQNLNRQVLYDVTSLGSPKVDVAADRLRAINPACDVTPIRQRISSAGEVENLVEELAPDILILGADRPVRAIDRWVSEACFHTGTPYITGGVSGVEGYVWAKVPGTTGCDECDRLWLQESSPLDFAIMAYREEHDLIPATSALAFGVQIIAGMIGYDSVRHFLGWPMESAGRFIHIDFFGLMMRRSERPSHQHCPICAAGAGQNEDEGTEA